MHGTFSQTLLILVLSSVSSAQFTRLTFPDFPCFKVLLWLLWYVFYILYIWYILCNCVFFLKGHHNSLSWTWCVLFRVHVFIFALYCICVHEQINDDDDDGGCRIFVFSKLCHTHSSVLARHGINSCFHPSAYTFLRLQRVIGLASCGAT